MVVDSGLGHASVAVVAELNGRRSDPLVIVYKGGHLPGSVSGVRSVPAHEDRGEYSEIRAPAAARLTADTAGTLRQLRAVKALAGKRRGHQLLQSRPVGSGGHVRRRLMSDHVRRRLMSLGGSESSGSSSSLGDRKIMTRSENSGISSSPGGGKQRSRRRLPRG